MMYNKSKQHMQNLKAARQKAVSVKVECGSCGKLFSKVGIKNHQASCRACPVCGTCFSGGRSKTCSHACANTFFRTGPGHGNWSETQYRSTCFHYHGKKCVICGEERIVEVHHLDEDHGNNRPENLIPMCPTHHQYWHSKYKSEVEGKVLEYIKMWSDKNTDQVPM